MVERATQEYRFLRRTVSIQFGTKHKQDEMVTLVRNKLPEVQATTLPAQILRNRGMLDNQSSTGRGFGRGSGSSVGRIKRIPARSGTELDLGRHNGSFVPRPLRNGEAGPIPEIINIGPPGVVTITDALDDEGSTWITTVPVDISAIRVLTEAEQNIVNENVRHIYMSKESCTLEMSNLPDKEADAVYALIEDTDRITLIVMVGKMIQIRIRLTSISNF
jgi:hypothetical protein